MGRQRTINDAEFWRAPRIADRTQEDKATLLYLLTSPYSNIIGVYPIVPRIAAAEMGWTADQLLAILRRLGTFELVTFEEPSGFVWVRNWWDHNSAKMAVATTLREKTYSQIAAIPATWREAFLADFLMRIPTGEKSSHGTKDDLRSIVARDLSGQGYSVPIPYRQAMDSPMGNTTDNTNSNSNNYSRDSLLEFPMLEAGMQEQLAAVISRLPSDMRQDVLDEIAAKLRAGTLRSPIRLAQHFVDNPSAFVIADGLAVRQARAKRAAVQDELDRQAEKRNSELASIDEQLSYMDDVQFENVYGRLPPNVLQQLRDRWSKLREGHRA
ncbi:MAG: hypothetical protein ACXWC4_05480 [Telluria sp.]